MEIRNARIEKTMLGYEDRGVFTCYITFEYGGSGSQSFGGYALSGKNPKDIYYTNQYCAKFIEGILKTVGVETWEDLVGQHVRVEQDHDGIKRMGNILEDVWFDPKKLYEETK